MNQIASETSGHFRDVLTALFETPENFDAWSLQQAFVVRIFLHKISFIFYPLFF